MTSEFIAIIAALIGIAYALRERVVIMRANAGNAEMQEIAAAIAEGARSFLRRQNTTIAITAILLAILLGVVPGLGGKVAVGFLIGAFMSALAGFIGMSTAVVSNSRTAEAARTGLPGAFRIAFRGGAVTGFLVSGLALLTITVFWLATKDLRALIGLAFGSSLVSVFARLGGGIYTKGADVGADLVGKIEAGIPEDDPRNPAVIADNVGDNVGDVAGMAADIFETYTVTATAAMFLGNLIFGGALAFVTYPLLLGAAAIIACIIGSSLTRVKEGGSIMGGLYRGLIISAVLALLLFIPVTQIALAGNVHYAWYAIYGAAALGIIATMFIVVITEYYTAKRFRPVQSIAEASVSGHATNIIMGLARGMEATAAPVIMITIGMLVAYNLAGLYGIAVAVMSMLSLSGIVVAIDAFGPITDNAGGIAEMAGLPKETREITDALDAVGNTTKAVTKGYAIVSAGFASLVLFASYSQDLRHILGREFVFSLTDPMVIAGLFIGGLLPYLFASLAMRAVGNAAGSVVTEVRRQFKEIPGIMERKARPDYSRIVDIVTKRALREMILPALIPIVATVIVAAISPTALGGLLMGTITTGLFVALSMTSGGAAWDNAKKYIEEGYLGGKGSPAHQAAVTGDTVGDPYKDTAGPAINPMIKVVNVVALLVIVLFA